MTCWYPLPNFLAKKTEKKKKAPDTAAYACGTSVWETESGRPEAQGLSS